MLLAKLRQLLDPLAADLGDAGEASWRNPYVIGSQVSWACWDMLKRLFVLYSPNKWVHSCSFLFPTFAVFWFGVIFQGLFSYLLYSSLWLILVNAPTASESAEVLAPLGYLGLLLIQSLQDGVRWGLMLEGMKLWSMLIIVCIIQLSSDCHSWFWSLIIYIDDMISWLSGLEVLICPVGGWEVLGSEDLIPKCIDMCFLELGLVMDYINYIAFHCIKICTTSKPFQIFLGVFSELVRLGAGLCTAEATSAVSGDGGTPCSPAVRFSLKTIQQSKKGS